jgi:hypothetical protein
MAVTDDQIKRHRHKWQLVGVLLGTHGESGYEWRCDRCHHAVIVPADTPTVFDRNGVPDCEG